MCLGGGAKAELCESSLYGVVGAANACPKWCGNDSPESFHAENGKLKAEEELEVP